ncbi:hypothetical protein [Nocardia nepalensis]|uniref:hypothetical protein n=1 Tax=Nocardia nepalensis TaxID=3375448 RepID=UPI003B67EA07
MNRKSSTGPVRPLIARIAITSALALAPIAAVTVPALAEPVDTQTPAIVQVDQPEDIHGYPGYGGWGHGGWGGWGGWGHRGWPGYPGYWPGYPSIWPGYVPLPSTGSAF